METLNDEQERRAQIAMMRFRDPQRGPFEPSGQQPTYSLHIGKTAQDRMPVDQRPRHQAAQQRRDLMKAAAS